MLTANKVNNEKSLLEAYGKRIAFSEDLYSRTHSGEKMSNFKKVTLAKLLENTNKFLNEAFGANSVGTQQQDMGAYKKFCLNLVTVAVPNLIAPELVIVYPMPSITGYITYVSYTAGTNKGETHQGDLFNNPFKLGNVDTNYTSNIVVEPFTGATSNVTASWYPVYNGDIEKYQAKITSITTAGGVNIPVADDASVTVDADGKTLTLSNGTGTAITATDTVKVKYVYDNIDIPQNDVPLLNANMAGIPLFAHARRIAVYYSQIAAFQTKNDYGFDLGDQLAEKAVGQLNYEIDTEVVSLLDETAGAAAPELVWSKTLPIGVSKVEHYTGFLEILEIAKALIYDKTKRFVPNYMLIHSSVKPILSLIPGWNEVPNNTVNGPYLAGTISGLKVFVTPALKWGRYAIGVNGDDYMSSVAVYAPYMPVVPTQLMQYNDGGTTQGFSTMYDLKVLNPDLIVAGEVTA